MTTFWQDVRYGVRMLGRSPGFTLVMVLVLSLGIGVSVGLFGYMEWRLHPPSPFSDPQRVVHLSVVNEATEKGELSYLDFLALREIIERLDSRVPVYPMTTLAQETQKQTRGRAADARLIGSLSLIGMAMAGIGLYGIVAFAVTRRTHELGVRLALGARSQDVLRAVMGQGLKLSLVGLALGLMGSFLLGRVLWASLFGTNSFDLIAFAGSSSVLLGAALLACYVPARRAAQVDPMAALRYE